MFLCFCIHDHFYLLPCIVKFYNVECLIVAFSSNCAHLCSGIQLEEWLPLGNGDTEVSFT